MINRYCHLAGIHQHITPHMFRHSFATLLLEQNVDIRYIQTMLGHSSINVTEIYTHVTMAKQKDILKTKHPRKSLNCMHRNRSTYPSICQKTIGSSWNTTQKVFLNGERPWGIPDSLL